MEQGATPKDHLKKPKIGLGAALSSTFQNSVLAATKFLSLKPLF